MAATDSDARAETISGAVIGCLDPQRAVQEVLRPKVERGGRSDVTVDRVALAEREVIGVAGKDLVARVNRPHAARSGELEDGREVARRTRRTISEQLPGIGHFNPLGAVEIVLRAEIQAPRVADVAIHHLAFAKREVVRTRGEHLGAVCHRLRARGAGEVVVLEAAGVGPARAAAPAEFRQPVEDVSRPLVERRAVVAWRADADQVAIDGNG